MDYSLSDIILQANSTAEWSCHDDMQRAVFYFKYFYYLIFNKKDDMMIYLALGYQTMYKLKLFFKFLKWLTLVRSNDGL